MQRKTVMCKIARKQGKRALREIGEEAEIGRFPFREDDLRYYKVKNILKRKQCCNDFYNGRFRFYG